MESANKMNAGSESNCVHEQVAKADCECPIYITYTNVNGYLIPNLTYKSGEQMAVSYTHLTLPTTPYV